MPSASTEPIVFQPGMCAGAWAMPTGSHTSVAIAVEAKETTTGWAGLQIPAGQQSAEAVAERHPDNRERAEHLALGLRADEQRDADEADRDADEPRYRSPAPRGRRRTRSAR